MTNDYRSLSISSVNLQYETTRFIQYLEKNTFHLIFYPNIVAADLAFDNYCDLIQSIKTFTRKATLDTDIAKRIQDLPVLTKKDFIFYSIPTWILCLLLPVGLILWISLYFKINALSLKLREMEAKLGTINLLLKQYY
jgi:hypothetical protein